MSGNVPAPDRPPREQWSSRGAFILATIGSAAGIGNIWRFAYVAGENGGGVFLLLYLACVALIGLPIVMAELSIGREIGRTAPTTMAVYTRLRLWRGFSLLSVVAAFAILSYYGVVAGWTVKYLAGALDGSLLRIAAGGHGAFFADFIADPVEPVFWQALVMAAAILIVTGGVRRGIEAANRILMPALMVIVIALAAFGLTLEGSRAGLAFLFAPDWSALARPQVYLAAMGQAFFSLGVGMAIFVTYGSYLPARQRIPGAAVAVVLGDTMIAMLAGTAIFSAVFAFGLDPAAGPELAFITLPQTFLAMPGGRFVAILFFALLVAGALTSMVSILEVPVAWLTARTPMGRRTAAVVTGSAIFVLGIPSALGFGPLAALTWHGRGILDTIDFAVSNLALPAGGILVVIFVGWVWGRANALRGADLSDRAAGRVWIWLIRYVTPVLTAIIVLRGLADV